MVYRYVYSQRGKQDKRDRKDMKASCEHLEVGTTVSEVRHMPEAIHSHQKLQKKRAVVCLKT